ncbi:MAG: ABC transporter permease [Actinomycetota bacterium]
MTAVGRTPSTGDGLVRSAPALQGLVARSLLRLVRVPQLIMPVVVMPAFFITAFSGSFDGVARVEGFPTDDVVNWVAAFAILQSCSFAGIGAASSMATDLESRFIDRLLVAPVRPTLLLVAPLAQAVVRSLIPTTVVLSIAWAQGASMPGGLLGLAVVYLGGVSVAVIMGCLGLGVVLLIGNMRAMAIVQVVVFLLMFPSTGQVPIELMDGWLASVAEINPITPMLAMTRQGFLGEVTWAETWPGLAVTVGGLAVFGGFARAQLRRLIG